MSTKKKSRLTLALATVLLVGLAGCGRSTATAPPSISPSGPALPSPSPSVSRDPRAAIHDFPRQGFALAYGGDWVAQYPNGSDWQLKDPPPGQPASWSMLLVGYSATRKETDRPEIVISVWPYRTSVDSVACQRDVAARLNAKHPYEIFRPTTVVIWPALMAAFRDPNAATAIEVERYLFGESGIVYDFELRAPLATWATDALVMRGVLQSFFLPGG